MDKSRSGGFLDGSRRLSRRWNSRRSFTSYCTHSLDTIDALEELRYEMFVVSVPNILQMDVLEPHQLMLQKGLLERWNREMQVIFVSHEWLGYRHADPNADQLNFLKLVLTRLMTGEIKEVNPHWLQNLATKSMRGIPVREWAPHLPSMYVWLDFLSIPQPTCPIPLPTEIAHRISEMNRQDSHNLSQEDSAAYVSADHRFQEGALNDALNKAVESIPQYIERSWMLLVLVPVCTHADKEQVCSISSWRSRGWCRMEFMAAILSCRRIYVLICNDAETQPYFVIPTDALQLPPCQGKFTCCSVGHVFDGHPISCDKDKVHHVLNKMLLAKQAHCKKHGFRSQAHLLSAMRHIVLVGLPKSSCELVNACSLEQFKEELGWMDLDDQNASKTGHTLLFYATIARNAQALPAAIENLARSKVSINYLTSDIELIWGQQPGKTTVLMHAMAFSSFDVVSMLLHAKADPYLSLSTKLKTNALSMGCMYGRTENVENWFLKFPEWNVNERRGVFGASYLVMAGSSPAASPELFRVLLHLRADPNMRSDFGSTVLMHVAIKDDTDVDSIRVLTKSGADTNLRFVPQTTKWKIVFWLMHLVASLGKRGLVEILSDFPGMTALHMAAQRGDLDLVKALISAKADVLANHYQPYRSQTNYAQKVQVVLQKALLEANSTEKSSSQTISQTFSAGAAAPSTESVASTSSQVIGSTCLAEVESLTRSIASEQQSWMFPLELDALCPHRRRMKGIYGVCPHHGICPHRERMRGSLPGPANALRVQIDESAQLSLTASGSDDGS